MAPMILPSTIIGKPPSIGVAPRRPSERMPMPPCATRSSNTLLRRRKTSSVCALSSARRDRAVLCVVEPVQHYRMAGAVENDYGHRPVVLHRLCLGGGAAVYWRVETDRGA